MNPTEMKNLAKTHIRHSWPTYQSYSEKSQKKEKNGCRC